MKPLNLLTQELLLNPAGTPPSENLPAEFDSSLPDLSPEEELTALDLERRRRASRRGCSPEAVTLSDDAVRLTLRFAREQKLSAIKTREYWARIDQPVSFISLSPEQMLSRFLETATALMRRPFILDDNNTAIIHKLCHYFSASPKAADLGLSLSKGILLAGGVGTGKTTIMKAFRDNPLQSFTLISSRQISFDFATRGFPLFSHHSQPISIPTNQFGHSRLGTCFDDLGTDDERKHYGEKLNALSEILTSRYENLPFNQTHLTTNLNAAMIETIYGTRLRSRMREMFNLISFPPSSPDRRI